MQTASHAAAQAELLGLTPASRETATLGRATTPSGTDVHLLCWPTFHNAWSPLLRLLSPMQASTSRSPTTPAKSSWLHVCSPRLGSLFQDSPAGESTLAALLTRATIRMVVHVPSKANADANISSPLHALSKCLQAYDDALKREKRQPVRQLIAARDVAVPGEQTREIFHRSHGNLEWLPTLHIKTDRAPQAPLVLEVSRVMAAAIARFNDTPDAYNPIFDAVLPKLANPPLHWHMSTRSRRR